MHTEGKRDKDINSRLDSSQHQDNFLYLVLF